MEDELKVGDSAPDFEIPGGSGKDRLSNYRGRIVVVYFYPKDFTPGCTTEACNFRDNFSDYKSKGIEVIGVSVDSEDSHKRFVDKYGLPFLLAPDGSKEISKKYNVLGLGTSKRVTFIINKQGKIAYVFPKVSPKEHAREVLDKIKELGLAA
ncbi:MAG: peroxiredoxin [Thermoplasmatales archaeon]|jgi:peroxiredoxin Q/BCP|nr:peroxiredoxin [Candidatus Thermoplasmatota archaeon]MDA8055176.1 peroxiredoxin [Thermoplasmatales archaeon]